MTAQGRLDRGLANLKAKKFLNNSETLAAVVKPVEKPVEKTEVKVKKVKKEVKNNGF